MINLEDMLNSSVHLGHPVKQWNPKMAAYIYGERNGIHLIDIVQTMICLAKTNEFLLKSAKENKTFLFVGTKKQFNSVINSCAESSGSFYITQRWLGGTLTNWLTIKGCINKLKLLEKADDENKLTKKETLILKKRKNRLERFLAGIKNMNKLPDVVILVGQIKDLNAVKECLKLKIPLISILDTNCDPNLTDLIIPANDDSVSSISLILNDLCNSISENSNIKQNFQRVILR
uniref:Small ribosomal subunit protein uS2c n=1 Tax=Lepocinclis ovum TaxID=86638 RepID=A0A3G3LLZ3_9EUGL|nr:ribosomal protein S2 [Lepocinclis ovum]AYQ93735.1 ribosomal protein S2 [Lepocinclis ovum]